MQNNHCCGFGILSSIVMLKRQAESLLEMAKSVPSMADKLGPGPPGDPHAVAPLPGSCVKSCDRAGGMDRAFVKPAVLYQMMPRQQRREAGKGRAKIRRISDMVRLDAM